ncbi:MAG TPA: 2OG-Fe(II) oxygenase [Bacteriovoracaceae bacterium]|nr:2OG-Fe(II) oxygenase [Bacteriovoracaceae bacterium]
MLKNPDLFQTGFHLSYFPLDESFRHWVKSENWELIDKEMKVLTSSSGRLFEYLRTYHDFSSIEFIISLRDSANDWEDDGIWHDDGSRVFAFSLSLTEDTGNLKGGRLGIKPKGQSGCFDVPTPGFGGIILFLTGLYGFEHRIQKVTKGRRVIIAGWCT